MTDWVEVMKAGTHRASSGALVPVTEQKLAAIARHYDPSFFEAPVVLGHPEDNAPAYGWVEGLKAEGGTLSARFKQVHDGFAQAVRDGRFKNRSVALYSDLDGRGSYLRHVGFLGAAPPAVKGMAPVKFAEGENDTFEFEKKESQAMDAKGIKEAVSEAMQSFSEKITAAIERLKPGGGEAAPDLKKRIDDAVKAATEGATAKFSEALDSVQAELKSARQQLAEQSQQTAGAGVKSFVEKQRAAGKWAPAWDQGAVEFMQALSDVETFEFSEGEGDKAKTVKQQPLAWFQSFVEGLPKVVEFGELTADAGTKGGQTKIVPFTQSGKLPAENVEFAERVAAIQREKKLSFDEAAALAGQAG